MPTIDWTEKLADQLDFHWTHQLRPRLDGLTDDEYFWEPVGDVWTLRPVAGRLAIDFAYPPPSPAPVTTIAWRVGHLVVSVFGMRAASHFGGPPMSYDTFEWAGGADEALAQLDAAYDSWMRGVRALDAAGLARPCGPAEGPYAAESMAVLVLHINREAIHHGAEIALLRDLYLRQGR